MITVCMDIKIIGGEQNIVKKSFSFCWKIAIMLGHEWDKSIFILHYLSSCNIADPLDPRMKMTGLRSLSREEIFVSQH